ncbi:fimbrial protein [Serratia nevei]|uniref:fimbrial protein n=1 Tax=Serratia nevei TaxID=2703794 RepID=UPI00313DC61D
MKGKMKTRWVFCLLSLCGGLWGGNGYAGSTVAVKVTVLAPLPCVLNEKQPIGIDFGNEVMTTRIDGQAYRQKVNYRLSCSGQGKNAMRLQIKGASAAFDATALQTNVNGLAIAFEQPVGKRLPVNGWANFDYPNLPDLYAVPVKKTGVNLPTGEFSAAATLRVDYQ